MITIPSLNNKRAFLIGNSNYTVEDELKQCRKDVEDVTDKLTNMDFKVVSHNDLPHKKMKEEINKFENEIEENDLVVFYFSGHGIQQNNRNYLIAVDQDVRSGVSIKPENYVCVPNTRDSIKSKCSPYATVFLLDCCRSYIQKEESQKRSIPSSNELTATYTSEKKEWAGYLIVFACGPNQETPGSSLDRVHSLFTSHLLKYIDVPGLDIGNMMIQVCAGVTEDTNRKIFVHQEIVLRAKIYFNGAENGKILLTNRR